MESIILRKRVEIAELLQKAPIGEDVLVKGWVRAFRARRFIALNDGSTFNNLQIVVDYDNFSEADTQKD